MERIERQLVSMRSEYGKLYLENKKEYLNLATTNTNNAYISYFINDTLRNIHTLQNLELKLSERLETNFPKLYEMFEASKNYTSEDYLESIIGRLEYRLSDIRSMLKNEKHNQLIGLLIQYLVEAAVNKFVSSFSEALTGVLSIENIFNGCVVQCTMKKDTVVNHKIEQKLKGFKLSKLFAPINRIFQSLKNFRKTVKSLTLKKFGQQIQKLGPKVWKLTTIMAKTFKAMVLGPIQELKQNFKSVSSTLKNIVNPLRRQTLKKNLRKKFADFKTKLKNFKSTLFSLKKMKTSLGSYIKTYKLETSDKVMGVIGVIADIVSQVTSAVQWKKTAEKVNNARIRYEKHHKEFLKELNKVKKEKLALAKSWIEVISVFKSSTLVFRTLMNNARNYTRFNDILGIPKLPIVTNNPIFTIQFQALNRINTQAAQEKVIDFLKDIDNDIIRVVDQMRARTIMYKTVLTLLENGDTVDYMFKTITDIFRFMTSDTVKHFGKTLTKKDLMCSISLLRYDLMTYDFFSLDIFRPSCDLSIKVYRQNELLASKRRNENLMKVIVIRKLKSNKSPVTLTDLTESVKDAYFAEDNPEISTYGEKLTDKDVICTIATEFPSKQEYDFISLAPFRPDCGPVDDNYFQKQKTGAGILRGMSLQIKSTLNTCKNYKFCPCPSLIANMFHLSSEQVINLIKIQAPEMAKYCGTTGCSCVLLK